ncbi:cobalamin biosynthesis protein [Roseovarius autotrophicus]|uniref:cobalamin biosynthesis protein n=1 Tax=Roseovarius autotrophicus TaxID=2824121 RepID=UPI0019D93B2B|nr:cobalamin biosynthesis protein [Roseovarius autotrophicus]MBE0453089.1 cobalamin biosynthesis protein [Roseovarius sp.]
MKIAGFGYASRATIRSLQDALARAEALTGPVDALAGPDDKVAQLALLAEARALPLIAVSAAALTSQDTASRSPRSLATRGTGSVAEASALAALGPPARLMATRVLSTDRLATCAIAERIRP